MRRNEVFWGCMLVALGALFFLQTAGYLRGDVFSWFWPMALMAAGAWILWGGFQRGVRSDSGDHLAIPLQGAGEAVLTVNHGMGRLEIGAGPSGPHFLTGNTAAGLSHSERLVGDRLEVSLEAGPSVIPFIGPQSGGWEFKLNPSVPTHLVLHAGASQILLGLGRLLVRQLDFEGGASSLRISLPAGVERFASRIRTGASSIELLVPEGVAARVVLTGPASPVVDEAHFARVSPGIYQSAGYDDAPRRAEVTIDGGASSIRITREPQ